MMKMRGQQAASQEGLYPERAAGASGGSEIDARHEQMLNRLADWIQARGLRSPAILFFEASKPLALLGSQVLLLLQPTLGLVGPFLGWSDGERMLAEYAALLEDATGIDRILDRLSAPPTERGSDERHVV